MPHKPAPNIRPLRVRYETNPPKCELQWLETKHFLPVSGETVLLAWPRSSGFTYRTGRRDGEGWVLSGDTKPRQDPTFFASLKDLG